MFIEAVKLNEVQKIYFKFILIFLLHWGVVGRQCCVSFRGNSKVSHLHVYIY